MNHDPIIQTTGLTRYFGRTCAVDGVSVSIPRGQVTALLGRNGSGKTTLLRMMLGLLPATRGSATVFGEDARRLSPAVRARVGYVAETHPLHDWMTVGQLGRHQAQFYPGWDRALFESVLSHFALPERVRIAGLSRGQRAGVSLAVTLAPRPELLILDDPALGLDPVARRLLLESMVQFTRDRQRTIVFSSHQVTDIERVADRLVILDRSIVRVDASIDRFRERVRQWLLVFDGNLPETLPALRGVLSVRRDGQEIRVTLANADEGVLERLSGLGPTRMTEIPNSLEDAIIAYLDQRTHPDTLTVAEPASQRGAA